MRYVYCHPLFDERKCAHRFSYQLKNTFQAAGLTLERFDYRGTGEGAGDFKDVSLETLRRDISQQVNGDKICLIGLRLGASLALDYCIRNPGAVRKMVLLEPIVNGAQYIDYLYRKQHIKDLITGKSPGMSRDNGYINIEGHKTNIHFLEQIQNIDLIDTAKENPGENSILIVQIANHSRVDPEIACLAKRLEGSAKRVNFESVNIPIFWERLPCADYSKLTERILRWCCD
jgi:hypothetical protein